MSVGNAKASGRNLILSQRKQKTALLIDSYQKPTALGVAGSRNQTASLGHGVPPSVPSRFFPLSQLCSCCVVGSSEPRGEEAPHLFKDCIYLFQKEREPKQGERQREKGREKHTPR